MMLSLEINFFFLSMNMQLTGVSLVVPLYDQSRWMIFIYAFTGHSRLSDDLSNVIVSCFILFFWSSNVTETIDAVERRLEECEIL